jgi:hypothetical protein
MGEGEAASRRIDLSPLCSSRKMIFIKAERCLSEISAKYSSSICKQNDECYITCKNLTRTCDQHRVEVAYPKWKANSDRYPGAQMAYDSAGSACALGGLPIAHHRRYEYETLEPINVISLSAVVFSKITFYLKGSRLAVLHT